MRMRTAMLIAGSILVVAPQLVAQTAETPTPAVEPAAAARIPGSVFVESNKTIEINAKDKDQSKQGDFGVSLRAALVKKQVPVKIVTDPARAAFTIRSTSSHREDSTGTKVAKILMFGGGGFGHFEGSVEVIDNESTAVVFAYNVKKGNYQSAAESFAKHYNNFLKKGGQ